MAATQPEGQATVIAVYPEHASAEEAVRRLHKEGIPMQNLSIIGKDFQLVVKPLGLVTTGDVASGGAKVGAWTGGIFGLLVGGLLVGAALLILPGIGPTLFPQYIGDEFLAFTSASCRFLKEVHAGDTLYPHLEIIKLTTQGDTGIVTTRATVHNQRGEIVLDGEHTYSLKAGSGDKK